MGGVVASGNLTNRAVGPWHRHVLRDVAAAAFCGETTGQLFGHGRLTGSCAVGRCSAERHGWALHVAPRWRLARELDRWVERRAQLAQLPLRGRAIPSPPDLTSRCTE